MRLVSEEGFNQHYHNFNPPPSHINNYTQQEEEEEPLE